MRRGRLGFALGIVFWARSGLALDDGPRAALVLARGAGTEACLRERAIERAVERRLRRHVFVEPGAADLRIDLALAREPDGAWSARLALRGPHGAELGARELETQAPHCSALDESLVLVVALLVDSPEARGAVEASKHEPLPSAPAPPTQTSTPSAPPRSRTQPGPIELPPDTFAPREPYRFELGAGAAFLPGAIPGVPFGPELSFGVRPPHFAAIRLRPAFFSSSEAHAPTADRGGRFSLVAVALDVCPAEQSVGRWRLFACAGQRVGRLAARGFGFQQTEHAVELYYALGATAGGTFWFTQPLGLALNLGAEAPLSRDAYFSFGPAGERRTIFRTSPVVGAATAGLVLAF
ncbi:MAG TPA: hypothetical protein VMI54_08075 [Polyangiaceae bacterium]|nr:hypothetical protein [Polyangiaceae bacterium]